MEKYIGDAIMAVFGVPVLQAYGSTEGGVTALERYEDALAGHRGPGSVGRVPSNMPFRIVDPNGDDVAQGLEGELIGRVRVSLCTGQFRCAVRI